MRYLLFIICLILLISVPVSANQLVAPDASLEAQQLMADQESDFADALMHILRSSINAVSPDITSALRICLTVIAATLLISFLQSLQPNENGVSGFVIAVGLSAILLTGTDYLIHEGAKTVADLSDYGKLFIPVMTAATAAQGGVTSAGVIYTATTIFDAILTTFIKTFLIPMIYIYLALSVANTAMSENALGKFRDFMRWLISWSLKTLLYIFTGYITITGVISGVTDMSAMKATKLTISSMVPVVGGILSDASEAVLVGAGVIKNSVGIAGLLAIIATVIGPFLRIGVHYLLLKFTAAATSVFANKRCTDLIQDFSTAMGLLLAMTGTECIILLISTVCMIRGVNV